MYANKLILREIKNIVKLKGGRGVQFVFDGVSIPYTDEEGKPQDLTVEGRQEEAGQFLPSQVIPNMSAKFKSGSDFSDYATASELTVIEEADLRRKLASGGLGPEAGQAGQAAKARLLKIAAERAAPPTEPPAELDQSVETGAEADPKAPVTSRPLVEFTVLPGWKVGSNQTVTFKDGRKSIIKVPQGAKLGKNIWVEEPLATTTRDHDWSETFKQKQRKLATPRADPRSSEHYFHTEAWSNEEGRSPSDRRFSSIKKIIYQCEEIKELTKSTRAFSEIIRDELVEIDKGVMRDTVSGTRDLGGTFGPGGKYKLGEGGVREEVSEAQRGESKGLSGVQSSINALIREIFDETQQELDGALAAVAVVASDVDSGHEGVRIVMSDSQSVCRILLKLKKVKLKMYFFYYNGLMPFKPEIDLKYSQTLLSSHHRQFGDLKKMYRMKEFFKTLRLRDGTIKWNDDAGDFLGKGAFGSVHLYDKKPLPDGIVTIMEPPLDYYSLPQKIVIKKTDRTDEDWGKESLILEITMLSHDTYGMNRDAFFPVYYGCFSDAAVYFAMDLGQELIKHIEDRERIDYIDCVRMAAEISVAVAFLHHNDIVHCDLKVENILVKMKGDVPHACVCDMGLSLYNFYTKSDEKKTQYCCINNRGAGRGGTNPFMPAELFMGYPSSQYSNEYYGFGYDWWCIGSIIFTLFTNFLLTSSKNKPKAMLRDLVAGEFGTEEGELKAWENMDFSNCYSLRVGQTDGHPRPDFVEEPGFVKMYNFVRCLLRQDPAKRAYATMVENASEGQGYTIKWENTDLERGGGISDKNLHLDLFSSSTDGSTDADEEVSFWKSIFDCNMREAGGPAGLDTSLHSASVAPISTLKQEQDKRAGSE